MRATSVKSQYQRLSSCYLASNVKTAAKPRKIIRETEDPHETYQRKKRSII